MLLHILIVIMQICLLALKTYCTVKDFRHCLICGIQSVNPWLSFRIEVLILMLWCNIKTDTYLLMIKFLLHEVSNNKHYIMNDLSFVHIANL